MSEIIMRLGLLLLLGTATWLLVLAGKHFVEKQRRQALTATPPTILSGIGTGETTPNSISPVRILAFSSIDCHQCKQLQAPALERVVEARQGDVTIMEVDAATEHDLVQTYHVLTVPSTVVLDTNGNANAVNYGFANTNRLLTQVDEVLTKVPALES
jgi:Thioredoxin